MMPSFVRETAPNTFTPLDGSQPIFVHSNGEPDVWHPPYILDVWGDEKLAAIGVYRILPFEVPAGKRITGNRTLTKVGNVVAEEYDVEDIPVQPPDHKKEISRRQLIIGLFRANFITKEEMVAAATVGAVPAFIAGAIANLPEPQRSEALATWATMSVCMRNDPLLAMLSQVNNVTDEQLDAYFDQFATI